MSASLMDNCCNCGGTPPPYGLENLRTIRADHRWEGYIPYHAGCVGSWGSTGVAPHLVWHEDGQYYSVEGYVAPSVADLTTALTSVVDDNEPVRYLHIVEETEADVLDNDELNPAIHHVKQTIAATVDARDHATVDYSEVYDPDPVPTNWGSSWGGKTSVEHHKTDGSDRTSGPYAPSQFVINSCPGTQYLYTGLLVSWSVTRTRLTEEITIVIWLQYKWDAIGSFTFRSKSSISSEYAATAALADAAAMANGVAWSEVPRRSGVLVQWVSGTSGISKTQTIGGWDSGTGVATWEVSDAGVTAGKTFVDDPDHVLCDVIGTGQELMEASTTLPLPGDGHAAQYITPPSTIYDVLAGGKYEFNWSWVFTATGEIYGHALYGTC